MVGGFNNSQRSERSDLSLEEVAVSQGGRWPLYLGIWVCYHDERDVYRISCCHLRKSQAKILFFMRPNNS